MPSAMRRSRVVLPSWPLSLAMLCYPLWWVLGLGDVGFLIAAGVMGLVLWQRTDVTVPRGFGVWLAFMLWMICSASQLDSAGRAIGFGYRFALYLAATVIFVYVYNSRLLTVDRLLRILVWFWVIVVVGGVLALLFPLFEWRTPLSYVMPSGLASNELVNEMIVRRFSQFDPNSWVQSGPRPSAPFVYTNNWGNVYSLLTPFALLTLVRPSTSGQRRFWLSIALVASLVPAFLSLNRGMFIGLGIVLVFVAFRAALAGNVRVLLGVVVLVVIAGGVAAQIDVESRLNERLETSSTTADRASLYRETLDQTMASPVLGFGAPRPSEVAGQPSVGTQGQLWMVLYSHGFVGAILFVGWLLWMLLVSLQRKDRFGWVCSGVLLAAIVEIAYYGMLASGLVVVMVVGAAAMRENGSADRESRIALSRLGAGRHAVRG